MMEFAESEAIVATIDCETAVRRLWDFLDGQLPTMARAEVEAHLATCALCPPHFAFAQQFRTALAASARPIPSHEEARLRARVRRALEHATRYPEQLAADEEKLGGA